MRPAAMAGTAARRPSRLRSRRSAAARVAACPWRFFAASGGGPLGEVDSPPQAAGFGPARLYPRSCCKWPARRKKRRFWLASNCSARFSGLKFCVLSTGVQCRSLPLGLERRRAADGQARPRHRSRSGRGSTAESQNAAQLGVRDRSPGLRSGRRGSGSRRRAGRDRIPGSRRAPRAHRSIAFG